MSQPKIAPLWLMALADHVGSDRRRGDRARPTCCSTARDVYWIESRPQGGQAATSWWRAGADVTPPGFNAAHARARIRRRARSRSRAASSISQTSRTSGSIARRRVAAPEAVHAGGEAALWPTAGSTRRAGRWIGRGARTTADRAEAVNTIVAIDPRDRRPGAGARARATISTPRRACRRTGGSPGSAGATRTCHGSRPSCGSRPSPATACAIRSRSRAAPPKSIFQPEWTPDGALIFRLRPQRLVETCIAGRGGDVEPPRADGGRVRPSRNGRSACRPTAVLSAERPRVQLCRGRPRQARGDRSAQRRAPGTDRPCPYSEFGAPARVAGERVVVSAPASAEPSPTRSCRSISRAAGARCWRRSLTLKPEIARMCSAPRDGRVSRPPAARPRSASTTRRTIPTTRRPAGRTRAAGREEPWRGRPVRRRAGSISASSFWTSRGIGVPRRQTTAARPASGREYRERLHKTWGVVDVDDCCNGGAPSRAREGPRRRRPPW